MNDNDNVVDFPTQQRKQTVKTEREGISPFYVVPSQNVNYTFSMDGIDIDFSQFSSAPVDTNLVTWTTTTNTNAADDLSRIIDLCSTLQKNSAQQALKCNQVVLKMIEDKLCEAVSISRMPKDP